MATFYTATVKIEAGNFYDLRTALQDRDGQAVTLQNSKKYMLQNIGDRLLRLVLEDRTLTAPVSRSHKLLSDEYWIFDMKSDASVYCWLDGTRGNTWIAVTES